MTELPNDIETLKGLVKELLEENAQLKIAVAELRRRLGLDSNTSHQPPSSDGYKKKTVKPGVPKEKNKPQGGQTGPQGNTLKRVEQPEHQLIHHPEQCHCCGPLPLS
jgi:regulator of replication initiation timing